MPDTHAESVRNYFAPTASGHTAGYTPATRAGYTYCRRRELVTRAIAVEGGGDLLDVGCGTGVYAPPSLAAGFVYVGVDTSPEMISAAAKENPSPNATFKVGQVEHLEEPDSSFDVVLALGVLEYVERRRLAEAVQELYRVLKHQGLLVVSVLNGSSPLWRTRRVRERVRRAAAHRRDRSCSSTALEEYYSRPELEVVLQKPGLTIDTVVPYSFVPIPSGLYAQAPRLFARGAARLEGHGTGPLGRLAIANLVLARRVDPTAV